MRPAGVFVILDNLVLAVTVTGGVPGMLWGAKKKSSDLSPAGGRKRGLAYWSIRVCLIAAATAALVYGILVWRDRPLVVAESALEGGDLKYAHYLLTRYLARNPDSHRAMALQARVLVAAGNPDGAIALFDQAGAATDEDRRAWTRALLLTEQWTLAIPLLERSLQSDPENPDVLYELTACRVRMGLFKDALETAQRLARLPGQEARGHVFVGAILRDLGRDAEAAEAYKAVLVHDPKAETLQTPREEFYLQYGQSLLRIGKPQEALEPLKLSAAARETPEVLLELGNAAMHLRRMDDAKLAWKRAVTIHESGVAAREALARAELQDGHPELALKWLEPLPDKDSTLESAYLRQRAYTLLDKDAEASKWQEQAAALRKKQEFSAELDTLLVDSPESFWARVVRTHRFAQQGSWRQAELMVEMLLREAPAEPFIIELASAVHRRRDLPPLENLPIKHH